MNILLLDTETNGLPTNRYAPISEPGVWPAILQLSWAVYTVDAGKMTLASSRDIGVALDPTVKWNTGAAAVHGLSEIECRHGTSAQEALTELAAALRSVDVVFAHNLEFDKPVIRAAGYAVGLRDLWPPRVKEICTMRATTDLVCLPPTERQKAYNISKYKSPKLNELFQWLFGHPYDVSGAVLHTAKSDVLCLAQCVRELLERKALVV